jgi:hypothetical protein
VSDFAVEQLVELLKTADSRAFVLRYSNREECERLWEELEQESGEVPWNTVVIVYDGQSDRTNMAFRPEHWLTPWDWSVAFSVHLYYHPERIPPGGLRCLVVDLSPAEWGAGGRTRFRTVGALAPWIRWYRPQPRLLASDFETLFSDLRNPSNLPRLDRLALGAPDMRALISTWTALFSTAGDRHAIGNIVAPLILAQGLLKTRGLDIRLSEDWVTKRFRSMVNCMSPAAPSVEPVPSRPLIPNLPEITDPTSDILHRFRRLRVVLVDDQYELGYHTILMRLLFGNDLSEASTSNLREASWTNPGSDIRLHSTGNPNFLLDWMQRALKAYPEAPRHLGEDLDILLLDLRLFADSKIDQASPDEKRFLEKAIDLCLGAQLQVGDEQLSSAIEAARSRIANGKEDLRALTLLPLLLSRIDPSLPIILFSSTHQREVVDVFRNFQNVITTFAKPVVSGYAAEDLPKVSAWDLERALLEALRLHRPRELWRLICCLGHDLQARHRKGDRIREAELSPAGDKSRSYQIDLRMVRILAGEYTYLLLRGRFTDALQLPDNLLEYLGARFDAPKWLTECDMLVLITVLDGLKSLLGQRRHRRSTWKIVEDGLRGMAQAGYKALDPAAASLMKFADAVKQPQYPDLHFREFRRIEPNATIEIETQYGSLSSAIYAALERRLHELLAQTLANNLSGLASFQFYSLLGAMRNARSHFICRPLEHDASIESSACWLWCFFLRAVRLRIAGEFPLSAGSGVCLADLETAAARPWLPTRNFDREIEGEEYCRGLITRFGHLLRLKILIPHPDFAEVGEYPLHLADLDG